MRSPRRARRVVPAVGTDRLLDAPSTIPHADDGGVRCAFRQERGLGWQGWLSRRSIAAGRPSLRREQTLRSTRRPTTAARGAAEVGAAAAARAAALEGAQVAVAAHRTGARSPAAARPARRWTVAATIAREAASTRSPAPTAPTTTTQCMPAQTAAAECASNRGDRARARRAAPPFLVAPGSRFRPARPSATRAGAR
jgi:hypothetical protein